MPQNWHPCRRPFPSPDAWTILDPILRDPEVRGVVIASSAISHAPLAKEAFMADKDVLVEKPMALNPKDAEEMLELAEKRKRVLMVGHLLIYHPVVDRLKEMIQSGELGKIHYIYTQRVNLGIIRQDENALWSFAPHDLSVILYLLDEEPGHCLCPWGELHSEGNRRCGLPQPPVFRWKDGQYPAELA